MERARARYRHSRKELVGLDIRALNFEQNAITILDGKNSRDRVVPITPREEWVTLYLQELRPKLANLQSDDALLTEVGNRIQPHKVTDMLTKCVQRSGIDKKGACHILRHAAATEMSRSGPNLRLLQKMLGHSSITSTEVYLHLQSTTYRRGTLRRIRRLLVVICMNFK